MVKDERGKVLNYVIEGGVLRHQPTGLTVPWGATKTAQRAAHALLKQKVAQHG